MLAAYVNWGRWVVNCPNCNSAELAAPGAAAFHCRECGYADGVLWPADLAAIEAALSKRPDARNRNWCPGETVEQLSLENVVHGLEEI